MSYKEISKGDLVFALDIGTRSVIGILGKKINNRINVEHIVVEFHEKRVMYNGQIHDIEGVTEIVQKVKSALEEKAGCSLYEVSMAAAGRSLKTSRISINREIDPIKEIDKDLINSLEVEGIQKAQCEIEKNCEEDTNYFCVGHTVVRYYINDGIIANPLGHKGKQVKLDILATFLPQIVVDSLYAVTSKLNLEVRYMTLEPIAAIEVAIPENARLLNLALVDIGAGTSDVAITKDGTVIAYGMTTSAGDAITEEISKCYLLDFDTAENLKINLSTEEIQTFYDIVGIYHEIESKEILKQIEPAIKNLANLISSNIVEQNGKAPSAVFLIGGGSQIPYLDKFVADELNLHENRVVVKGIETIKNTISISSTVSGPEYITPIGILSKAINNQELDFIDIYVNGQHFKLFQTKNLKVKDALALAGFNPRNLVPKRGKAINITLNNDKRILHGQYGRAAEVLINGKISNIESSIKNGDIINIHSAEEGQPARYYLTEILSLKNEIYINEKPTLQIYNVTINNEKPEDEITIKEGDRIQYCSIESVKDLCEYLSINYEEHDIKVNNKPASLDDKIQNKDYITIENNTSLDVLQEKAEVLNNTMNLRDEFVIVKCNDKILEIPKNSSEIIFVDIFDYIDFDRSTVKGKLVLLINGRNASYTDLINNGDEIKIYWSN